VAAERTAVEAAGVAAVAAAVAEAAAGVAAVAESAAAAAAAAAEEAAEIRPPPVQAMTVSRDSLIMTGDQEENEVMMDSFMMTGDQKQHEPNKQPAERVLDGALIDETEGPLERMVPSR